MKWPIRPAPDPFRAYRVDAIAALSAGAAQRGIYLGHRRFLVPRHHARRRHPDHRHGGDERVPPGAPDQDLGAQRPSSDPAAEIAADRLRGRRRPRLEGSGHLSRRAAGRGPGAGVLAVQCLRRRRARHARRRSRKAHAGLQEHQAGHARRLRRRPGHRHRRAARRAAFGAGRRQSHAGGAARRGNADGHDAAHQGLQDRRRLRDRHVRIRFRLRLHAADRGAGLFQSRRRRHRDRGLYRRSRPHRQLPQSA